MVKQQAPQSNGFERVFLAIGDPALPAYVRRLTPEKRERWIAQWNASFATCSLKGGKDCAAKAFAKANTAILAASHPVNKRFAEVEVYDAPEEFRLFMDSPALANFSEATPQFKAPEWIPYLPKPHVYTHKDYGKIDISASRNAEFVANFKAGIYQTRIPLDAEHQYKLSGAMGWIVDMRLNGEGGVDAKVEWTDIGLQMLKEKRYRYISPEFYAKWPHPATGQIHSNVATGGALTTRPFFKEPYLKQIPLVASERGTMSIPDGWDAELPGGEFNESDEIVVGDMDIPVIVVANEKGNTDMTDKISPERYAELLQAETSVTALTEQLNTAQAQIASFNEQISTLNTQLAEKDSALAELASTVKEQQDAARQQKFSEALKGTPNADKHLAHVMKLAQTFGEDDAIVTDYIASQQAAAASVRTGQAFNEVGSSAISNDNLSGDTAEAKIATLARQMSEEKGISVPAAWVKVMELQPQLYADYKRETGRL